MSTKVSAFADDGLKESVDALIEVVQELYLSDKIPWVVGYSGGKDSTATLQLVWLSLAALPKEKRHKEVHVISTDTLVENPVVAQWVNHSLTSMTSAARNQGLPIIAHRLTPSVADSFWVNLIGKGYPAPRPKFRWCTDRLKIRPSNTFIMEMIEARGEAILVLGTRRAESSVRSARMKRFAEQRTRDHLSPHTTLPNALIFSPIEHWTDDDVWLYLMQVKNPWGYNNKDLLTMYQGASADGECPLVVDTTTPSCGNSRFGCWVCTLVSEDKSMSAMIQNDHEKEWMLPLLQLRNELDVDDDRHLRDFRRMAGQVQLFADRVIPGPYTQSSRENWLRKLLQAQVLIREDGPPEMRDFEVISIEELHAIRHIWVNDKHEVEDSLPSLYEEVIGAPYPGPQLANPHAFGRDEMKVLRQVCDGDDIHFELVRALLDIEGKYRSHSKRAGLFKELHKALKKGSYTGAEEAGDVARMQRDLFKQAELKANAKLEGKVPGIRVEVSS